jgi:hypothetical protein
VRAVNILDPSLDPNTAIHGITKRYWTCSHFGRRQIITPGVTLGKIGGTPAAA